MSVKNKQLYEVWDIIVLLSTLYAAICIPVELAFKTHLVSFGLAHWLISLVFLLDFVRSVGKFKIGERSGEYREFEEQAEFQVVLLSADLLAAIPFALFLPVPFLNLFRLCKLIRIHYIFRTRQQFMMRHAGMFTLLTFIFWFTISINGLVCGWYSLGTHDQGSDFSTNYINALYWTTTTLTAVGYGDIIPISNPQKLYAMFVEILGFGVFTFLIGTVASRLIRKDPATVRYRDNIDSLASLMHYRSLPGDLRDRIIDFYKHIWRKRLGYDETAFLQSLPNSLRTEVALHLKREVIEKVSLFNNASDKFKREIALLLKPIFLAPGDYIFKAGDVGKKMYFVVNGTLDTLTRSEDQVLTRLEAGDFFGEIALFKNQDRSATIKALSYCDIYALDKSSFDKVLANYPEIGKRIWETVQQRESKYSV
ncbi:MAG: cyclic nucleotide-binding domain-containing protein [Saprospiraceae bacterium]|nr:cyclic nucleotide-binding domain-containing protein [Saprospiraceae bacterium]